MHNDHKFVPVDSDTYLHEISESQLFSTTFQATSTFSSCKSGSRSGLDYAKNICAG